MRDFTTSFFVALSLLALASAPLYSDGSGVQPRILSSGLPAFFDPAPNYRLCTDEGDTWQLTDGAGQGQRSRFEGAAANLPKPLPGMTAEERGSASLWGSKSSVGWSRLREPLVITFDLGKVQRVGSVMLSSAAGASGVYWPHAIGVAVSDDNVTWAYAGDLIVKSRKNGLPPAMGYSGHIFRSDDFNVDARYVALCVHPGSTHMFFTDEIEIGEGDASRPADKPKVIGDLAALRDSVRKGTTAHLVVRRQVADYALVEAAIRDASLADDKKTKLLARLAELEEASAEVPHELEGRVRTVMPITDLQRQILAVRGALLQELGHPALGVAKSHRYAYLGWLSNSVHKEQGAVTLSYRQMRDETRGDMVLLTNATPLAQKVQLKLNAPLEGISLLYCPWVDTPQLEPVATALLPATRNETGWEVEVPPGLTLKVQVNVDASKLPPGKHERELAVEGAAEAVVRLDIDISQMAMGERRIHLGMWDYTNNEGYDGITSRNREAAIGLMRSHGVDSPWATRRVAPLPKAEDFDENDNLRVEPDFSELDAWVARWPGARRYMIFVNVGGSIGEVPMGSSRFGKRVGAWAGSLARHVEKLGLKPGQIHLSLVDEPRGDETERRSATWAKAVKEHVSELVVWSNPVSEAPADSSVQEAFDLPDVLCPNLGVVRRGGAKQWEFYERQQKNGKGMELYLCSALAPHTDPNSYFRLTALAGWRLRIQGIGFWAFHSQGGLKDAWHAYEETKGGIWYSPAFLGEDDVADTLQWQAVRESLLDYEYLRLLEEALPKIKNEALRKRGEHLLSDEVTRGVFETEKVAGSIAWHETGNWEAPDNYRKRVLDLLDKAAAGGF